MKKIDIKDKKDEELLESIGEAKDILHESRFQIAGAAPKAPHKIREARKTVARALTELRRRKS